MGALVLIMSLLFYVQTRHGFHHLLVPLVVKFTGTKVEARDGRLSLLGTLRVDELLYQDPKTGISFAVERVTLRAVPWSFMTEGAPRIEELEIKGANLKMVHQPGQETESVLEEKMEPAFRPILVFVAIERARFDDVTVTLEHGNRRITGQVAATLEKFGPARAGNFTLQTDFLLERDGTPDVSGKIDMTLSVDVGPGGTPIAWSGSNSVLARAGRGAMEASDPEVVNFKQTLAGLYDWGAQSLRASSTIMIGRGEASSGTSELMVSMEGGSRPAVTDISLTLADVMGDTLNLWLGETSATSVYAGRFDAKVAAHVVGTQTSIRGEVTGSGVRLKLGDQEASPAVDISLKQVGSFNSATKDLAIETLTLGCSNRGKTLLSGMLDRPVSLHLDWRKGGTLPSGADAEPAVWSLRLSPQSSVQTLRPWLALLLGRDPMQRVAAGRFGGSLHVSMYEHGTIVDVASRLEGIEVMLRGQEGKREVLVGPVGIVADWKSRLTDLQLFKLDPLMTRVTLKGKPVAAMHATALWRVGNATRITALKGTVKLTGLPGETLNPLFDGWGQTRIGQAQIDGQAKVDIEQGRVRWEVDVRGQEVQMHLPNATTDAPSLDLWAKQAGEFDPTAHELRLDWLNIQILEQRRPVVTIWLDQPLMLSLAQGTEGNASKIGGSSKPITLGLRVNRLGIHQLRPWVAMAASQPLALIRGGALDADLKVRLSGDHDVGVVGRLDLNEVTVEREKRARAPITLNTEVRASVVGRSRITIDSWTVQALVRKRLLAQARLAGSASFGSETNFALDLTASDLSQLVDRLGLLTERQQGLISGGTLAGDMRLVMAGPQQPVAFKAAFRSANLNIGLDKTHPLIRSLGLQAEVEVDPAWSVAELRHVEAIVESVGARSGTLTASGRWPLADAGTTTPIGILSVTVKDWDSEPFAKFFGIMPGRTPGPLPLNADLRVTQEPGDKPLVLQGNETLGPISVAVNGRDPEPTTIHLVHDIAKSGDAIRITALSLIAERPKGRSDRAAVNGSFRIGPRPHVQLHGSLDAFDADWYGALAASPSDRPSTGKTFDTRHDAKDDATGLALPWDLDVDLSIGSITYRTLEISNGRLLAKGDGSTMQVTLQPTDLAGGSVQGVVTVALKGGQLEFSWDAEGNALDLSVLTKVAYAESEPRVTGRGRFITSGTAQGQGEMLRRSLSGTAVFNIADGQFIKSRLFEFIAEQTHIQQFRGLGFQTARGELQIKDEWVQLNQVRVDGPSVAVEAGGKIGLDGQLDIQVQPKVGPTLSDHVHIPCVDQFMKTVDGFTVLPIAITVTGTAEKSAYGVDVMAGSMIRRHTATLIGTIANLVTACQGGEAAQKATEKALGTATTTMDDLIKDVFVGKKNR